MTEELSLRIKAVNATKAAIDASVRGIRRLGRVSKRVAAGMRRSFSVASAGIKRTMGAAFAGVALAAAGLGATLKKSFEFETLTTQFEVLFGDLKKAQDHMKALKEFSAKTPFEISDIAVASRQLNVFSGGLLGATDSLTLVGDAASATGQEMKDVAFWFGRAFSAVKAGQPFGEAALRLQEMGILSAEARLKMDKLSEAGKGSQEIFAVLTGEFGKFAGGMDKASKTGDGLVSTLKDNLNQTLAQIGDTFQDVGKNKIASMIEWMVKLRDGGEIEDWADNVFAALEKAKGAFGKFKADLQKTAAFLGALSGGASINEAVNIANSQAVANKLAAGKADAVGTHFPSVPNEFGIKSATTSVSSESAVNDIVKKVLSSSGVRSATGKGLPSVGLGQVFSTARGNSGKPELGTISNPTHVVVVKDTSAPGAI
jgi:hypothetical protein